MKRTITLCLLLLAVNISYAQGIKFEEGLTWAQIKAKAKAEHKYIFMDCYATWCGPCKAMAKYVFPIKEVGDYFNAHFINVSVQMDSTAKDPENIRKWYPDVKFITSAYGVVAYPTFLFFSPEGEVLDRIAGGFEAKEFIARASDALTPEKQYYTMINGVKKHLNDSVFLRHALETTEATGDIRNAAKIAGCYLTCVKNPYVKETVDFIIHSNAVRGDKAFEFLFVNASRIDQVLIDGNGSKSYDRYVEDYLAMSMSAAIADSLMARKDTVLKLPEITKYRTGLYPTIKPELTLWLRARFVNGIDYKIKNAIYAERAPAPNWEAIAQNFNKRFPGLDCRRMVFKHQPEYYLLKKMFTECERSAIAFLDYYGNQLSADDLNGWVWSYLFMYSTAPDTLEATLKWQKRVLRLAPQNSQYIDTYANVLYKTGNKEEAIEWENKAIAIGESQKDEDNLKDYRKNLLKMQKGEPTWGNTNAGQ